MSDNFCALCREYGRDQYLVPYLRASHPGGTVDDALELALYTKRAGIDPDQVQDFYPTPGTASTVMYYTGIDPFTGKKVYTPTDPREKKICRALLQWRRRENRAIIAEAEDYCSPRGKEMLRELLENGKNTGKNVKKTASRRETKKPERKKKR